MGILKSFLYAWQGFWYCVTTQRNFRFHIVAAISVLIVSLFYEFDMLQMVMLWFAILFVFICEMINTAIESAVDMYGKDFNINAKNAKDVAAGAVLLSAVMSVVIAITLFWDIPRIMSVINYFVERQYMWLLLIIYALLSMYFVIGLPFKKNRG